MIYISVSDSKNYVLGKNTFVPTLTEAHFWVESSNTILQFKCIVASFKCDTAVSLERLYQTSAELNIVKAIVFREL